MNSNVNNIIKKYYDKLKNLEKIKKRFFVKGVITVKCDRCIVLFYFLKYFIMFSKF